MIVGNEPGHGTTFTLYLSQSVDEEPTIIRNAALEIAEPGVGTCILGAEEGHHDVEPIYNYCSVKQLSTISQENIK